MIRVSKQKIRVRWWTDNARASYYKVHQRGSCCSNRFFFSISFRSPFFPLALLFIRIHVYIRCVPMYVCMQRIKDPACPLHSTNQPFAARVRRRRALLSDPRGVGAPAGCCCIYDRRGTFCTLPHKYRFTLPVYIYTADPPALAEYKKSQLGFRETLCAV